MCFWDCAAGFRSPLLLFLALASFNLHHLQAQEQEPPVLNAGAAEQVSTAGYYTLEWTGPPGDSEATQSFELLEGTEADFHNSNIIYRGPDLATTISGKQDGTYFYRIRTVGEGMDETGPWSNVHRVIVEHHELNRAFTFLIVGAIVFAATLATILFGNLREGSSSQPEST